MNLLGRNFLDSIYLPIYGSLLLILWTAIVSPFSKYGDYWALVPALLVFPVVLCMHIVMIVKGEWQAKLIWYGVGHVALLFLVWIMCIMLISKDSL